jgi:TolB-like protein/DNA-binding winged helix-turn-helix (wHTH) protein/Tfp pilus assembly protein PilF
MAIKPTYEFGRFRLDTEARILLTGGEVISLTPKVVELLIVLVEKAGQVVPKDDLMKAVWPDTFVEEGNLTSNISILRKQLGVLPQGGEYIETIPKRGYRFVATVAAAPPAEIPRDSPPVESSGITVAVGIRTRSVQIGAVAVVVGLLILLVLHRVIARGSLLHFGSSPRIEALAVLPLANLSGDPAQDYFADGMTEALTADLAQISALKVISRASVMQYKGTKRPLPEIARQLKVDAVVLGSVLRSGQRVRITAELIHAASDRHLWARTYERDLDDILHLQGDVARAIASEIQAKVTPQEQRKLASSRAVDRDAYEAYLKGRYYWNTYTPEMLRKSIGYFERAIELDHGYAAAYAGLADAYLGLQYTGATTPEEIHRKALEAATKALQIDDNLVDAHAVMAVVKANEWDWTAAERECKKAFELNPGYARAHWSYSNQLRHRGRLDESIAEARRALDLDPLSPLTNESLADSYRSARQYDRAIAQYQKTLELYPNQAATRDSLGWAYVYQGKYDLGMDEIQKSYGEDPSISPELAYIHALRGNTGEAQKILQRLLTLSKKTPIEPHHFALIYAGLGRKEEALVMLEQAYRQHSPMMTWLKVDPRFDSLRPDPRFQDLMRRVGLL